jgi:hypothetical protein
VFRAKTASAYASVPVSDFLRAYDALILPSSFHVEEGALAGAFTDDEISAMKRYLYLVDELRRCAYFMEQERSMHVTMDEGVTTSFEMTLPGDGPTRDMLGLLRQLFGEKERASFASMVSLLRSHADPGTSQGQTLNDVLQRFELIRKGALDSWDLQPDGKENSPQPPLEVFLDWMYGEYLHSDADKAKRIEELDGGTGLYKWQFHWIAERLAHLFGWFSRVVEESLAIQAKPQPSE